MYSSVLRFLFFSLTLILVFKIFWFDFQFVSHRQELRDFGLNWFKELLSIVVNNVIHWDWIILFLEILHGFFLLLFVIAEDNHIRNGWRWSQIMLEETIDETKSSSTRNNEACVNTGLGKMNGLLLIINEFKWNNTVEFFINKRSN